uniref:Uncharacterized protein n=1 Tax=Cacopsylla melanoneura TaxID=428564 RepID=A0A8D8Y2P2_9HEMI
MGFHFPNVLTHLSHTVLTSDKVSTKDSPNLFPTSHRIPPPIFWFIGFPAVQKVRISICHKIASGFLSSSLPPLFSFIFIKTRFSNSLFFFLSLLQYSLLLLCFEEEKKKLLLCLNFPVFFSSVRRRLYGPD